MKQLVVLGGLAIAVLVSGCRTTYLVADVASGEVGAGLTLKNRYRVESCSIARCDDLGWFWDNKLRVVAQGSAIENEVPQIARMYPNVFSTSPDAIAVKVTIRVMGVDVDGEKAKCQLEVSEAKTGEPMGCETITFEQRDMSDSDLRALHDVQSCREIHVDQAYQKTVIEGFAGAVAAALEKAENGGVRVRTERRPPWFEMSVMPIEKPF